MAAISLVLANPICRLKPKSSRVRQSIPCFIPLTEPYARVRIRLLFYCTNIGSGRTYCTGSLVLITSSITNGICSRIGLRHFLQTHPHRQPNLVRLRYVPISSYRFLQTPPLASDALANRIFFPVNGARSVASTDWVCQLRWANKKLPSA